MSPVWSESGAGRGGRPPNAEMLERLSFLERIVSGIFALGLAVPFRSETVRRVVVE